MHYSNTANLAEIPRGSSSIIRCPGPRLQLGLEVGRQREDAVSWESSGRAKRGRGLLLALGAVAVVDGEWLGLRRVEVDVAALTGHSHVRWAAAWVFRWLAKYEMKRADVN